MLCHERGSPCDERRLNVRTFLVHGQRDRSDSRRGLPQQLNRLESITVRHFKIDQRDVNIGRINGFESFSAIGSLPNTLHVRLGGKKRRDASSKDRVIID